MKELVFRNLTADEIELRVGNTKRKYPKQPKGSDNPVVGFQVLLYKTARVDANILDETVGTFNWQKRFYQVKNTMICSLGINMNYDEPDKEPYWVFKDDAGDESETEAIKGEASDSFKRAAFAFGIGRNNLYYSPFIWFNCNDEINEFTKMYVSDIAYDKNGIISKLVIKERNSEKVLYTYPKGAKVSQTAEKPQKNDILEEASKNIGNDFLEESAITKETMGKINDITGRFDTDKYNNFKTYLQKVFNVQSIGELTEKQGKQLIKALGGK